jgi:hypothetical protein
MAKLNPKPDPAKPDPTSQIKLAKITMWQAILVAVITTLGGIATGYFASGGFTKKEEKKDEVQLPKGSVPSVQPIEVDSLPKEINNDDYILLKDISIFDLRNWKYTPDSLKNKKNSAVNYTNYLHIKKLKPINFITAHYATSGLQIDMRCITQPAPFFKKKDKPDKFHSDSTEKEYAIQIDVSKMELGKEFLVVVEATYWNSFNDTSKNDASTYTEKEIKNMEELGLIVFFPENKPFKNLSYYNTPFETGVESSYISNSTTFPDVKKKFIYWSIKEREANNHYTMKWDW